MGADRERPEQAPPARAAAVLVLGRGRLGAGADRQAPAAYVHRPDGPDRGQRHARPPADEAVEAGGQPQVAEEQVPAPSAGRNEGAKVSISAPKRPPPASAG